MTDKPASRITAPEPSTCANCLYVFDYQGRVLCRRYPPQPKHNSGFLGVPDTRREYWCGEWRQSTGPTPVVERLP